MLRDDLLYPVFKDMGTAHTRHVAHFIGEVFGGPTTYTSSDGGSHAAMVAHHLGKMLSEEKRKRWIDLFLLSADEVGLANDPEFRSALVGYLEWGSRIAVINSTTTEIQFKKINLCRNGDGGKPVNHTKVDICPSLYIYEEKGVVISS